MINAMSKYCDALHMQISAPKTKVLVLKGDKGQTFTLADQTLDQVSALEQVDKFKYLGLHFHESGHISHMIKPILDKATAA